MNVATQYLALKVLLVILFKKMDFKKKQKKMQKKIKIKNVFLSSNLSLPPYFEICKKKYFEKFSKPVLYEDFQIWANFQILFGTTVTKTVTVTVTSPMKIFPKKLKEGIVNMYTKGYEIWNGSSWPKFAHKSTP